MINTLFFDFAGVITKSPLFPKVAENLGTRYNISKEQILARLKIKEKEYLLGKISTEQFWRATCEGTSIPYDEFVEEISRYELNDDVIKIVHLLKNRYKVILISDNYDALYATMQKDKGLEGLFDEEFYSHQLHMIKIHGEDKIFKHVLDCIGAHAQECVFIDDKDINLIAPKLLGIHTVKFKDAAQLKEELKQLGVTVDQNTSTKKTYLLSTTIILLVKLLWI